MTHCLIDLECNGRLMDGTADVARSRATPLLALLHGQISDSLANAMPSSTPSNIQYPIASPLSVLYGAFEFHLPTTQRD
ncbi:hypothetical protein AB1N83_013855 [Pleurotus pulmonarius]